MSSLRYWVWLSSVSFANPRAKYALIERYGDAESAFLAPPGEYRSLPGVSANEAEIFERRDLREADRILEACRAMAPLNSFLNTAMQGFKMPEW